VEQPGFDGRHRNQDGKIRRKNSNTKVGTLRAEYGYDFAKGSRSNMHLGTLLKKEVRVSQQITKGETVVGGFLACPFRRLFRRRS